MRKDRPGPSKTRPRLIDRFNLATSSSSRHVDGLWVGSHRTPDDVKRVEGALLLIKQHSPLHYSRILKNLERIWIFLLPQSRAVYNSSLRACVLDERYVANPATGIEQIALTIVHESTHSKLDHCGVKYQEQLRTRIEAICKRRELALAAQLPASTQLQKEIREQLDWIQANPHYFTDAQIRDRQSLGESEVLRFVGFPEWYVRAHPTLKSMFRRVRDVFRII
jgi:hypothetical protein